MSILTWKDEYSVGVRIIDNEHKQLIAMINKAYDSVEKMEEEKVLLELVDEMRKYAMTHFATEEKLMEIHNYPETAEQKKQHNDFMIKAASSDNMLSSDNGAVDPIKVFKYLADWLRGHIMGTDKKLGIFLNEKGIK
ncbi:bacteriohemerythrin [Maridesulfovibrio hydrothermalis]|uniref:Hemerythrin-like metal-binding protein n=1 Tax=Maridesulfovibrio hydrothermalis AM13 = DSM 14728 TaxID=1121451 RepID=L0R9R4_9BACT|nr:bacteriohemerythrin [Maridesulfovibrio hydrothermalis]CCO22947.1 Hemerythrin-like metal-binding protein [Maridesulfovibrio hydrothermalis AM13 = DSM 14728]